LLFGLFVICHESEAGFIYFFVWVQKEKGHSFCLKAQNAVIGEVIFLVPVLSIQQDVCPAI